MGRLGCERRLLPCRHSPGSGAVCSRHRFRQNPSLVSSWVDLVLPDVTDGESRHWIQGWRCLCSLVCQAHRLLQEPSPAAQRGTDPKELANPRLSPCSALGEQSCLPAASRAWAAPHKQRDSSWTSHLSAVGPNSLLWICIL